MDREANGSGVIWAGCGSGGGGLGGGEEWYVEDVIFFLGVLRKNNDLNVRDLAEEAAFSAGRSGWRMTEDDDDVSVGAVKCVFAETYDTDDCGRTTEDVGENKGRLAEDEELLDESVVPSKLITPFAQLVG